MSGVRRPEQVGRNTALRESSRLTQERAKARRDDEVRELEERTERLRAERLARDATKVSPPARAKRA